MKVAVLRLLLQQLVFRKYISLASFLILCMNFVNACEAVSRSADHAERRQAEAFLIEFASREKASASLPVCRSLLEASDAAPVVLFHALSAVKLILIRDYDPSVSSEWLFFLLNLVRGLQWDRLAPFVRGQYFQAIALLVKRSWMQDKGGNQAVFSKILEISAAGNVRVTASY